MLLSIKIRISGQWTASSNDRAILPVANASSYPNWHVRMYVSYVSYQLNAKLNKVVRSHTLCVPPSKWRSSVFVCECVCLYRFHLVVKLHAHTHICNPRGKLWRRLNQPRRARSPRIHASSSPKPTSPARRPVDEACVLLFSFDCLLIVACVSLQASALRRASMGIERLYIICHFYIAATGWWCGVARRNGHIPWAPLTPPFAFSLASKSTNRFFVKHRVRCCLRECARARASKRAWWRV